MIYMHFFNLLSPDMINQDDPMPNLIMIWINWKNFHVCGFVALEPNSNKICQTLEYARLGYIQ